MYNTCTCMCMKVQEVNFQQLILDRRGSHPSVCSGIPIVITHAKGRATYMNIQVLRFTCKKHERYRGYIYTCKDVWSWD